MVALIFYGDLKFCPYIHKYIERIERQKLDYKVYFWNRAGGEYDLEYKYDYYDKKSKLKKNKIIKFMEFLKFKRWITDKIEQDKPEKIIILATWTGILLNKALKKYKNKYIFDIRDYSYENIPMFYSIEKKIIYNSYFTAISSRGFLKFLPENNYIITHNFNKKYAESEYKINKKNKVIKLVWNGLICRFDFQKKYIDALKNDSRFLMIYNGTGPDLELYENYCKSNNINNVIFTGEYNESDKEKLIREASILNNAYGEGDREVIWLTTAISNKFYDGVIFHIPQLVEPVGYKTDVVLKNNIGVNFTADEKFADKLYEYYQSINNDKFDRSCKNLLEKILKEDEIYRKKIDSFLKE